MTEQQKQRHQALSVIIPVFNCEDLLERCVDSVLNQNINLDVILVDDGSNDSSGELCDRLAFSNHNVRSFHKENQGVSSARNFGLDRALGEFVTFVDSDDFVPESSFRRLLSPLLENPDIGISCCQYCTIPEGDNPCCEMDTSNGASGLFYSPQEAMESCLDDGPIGFTVYAKAFRTSLFNGAKRVRFPHGKLMEEAAVLPVLFNRSSIVCLSDYIGYVYCKRRDSYTTKALSTECYAVYETFQDYMRVLPELYPSLDLIHLKNWHTKNAMYLYRTALYEKEEHIIPLDVFQRVKSEFFKIYPKALLSRNLGLRNRMLLVDTATRFFLVRKRILKRFT